MTPKPTKKESPTFTDNQGNGWVYCTGRCYVRIFAPLAGTKKYVQAKPTKKKSCGGGSCKCVLFRYPNPKNPREKKLILEDENGKAVVRKAGAKYSARCVRKV